MPLTRRRFVGATALLGLSTACSAPPAAAGRPVDSADALIDFIAAHPGNASLLVDDGRGAVFSLSPDRTRPIASASKVVHLTAYAQAVTAGRLDPDAPVPVAEWDRWYVPGTDGGAHPKALQSLGLGTDGSARRDDIAAVMTDFGDNVATDLLRATLGDAAEIAAARPTPAIPPSGWPRRSGPRRSRPPPRPPRRRALPRNPCRGGSTAPPRHPARGHPPHG